MPVRFTADHEPDVERREPRDNLAEIIDLRARLAEHTKRQGAGRGSAGRAERLDHGRSGARAPREIHNGAEQTVTDTLAARFGKPHTRTGSAESDAAETGATEAGATETDAAALMEQAMKKLARKPLSEAELREYLLREAHPVELVEDTVAECLDRHYLNDRDLARAVTETMRERKNASRGEIARALHQRRIDSRTIDEVLAELDPDTEHELLQQAAENRARKLIGLDRPTAERRLIAFLARRGWRGSEATEIALAALDAAGVNNRGTVRFQAADGVE